MVVPLAAVNRSSWGQPCDFGATIAFFDIGHPSSCDDLFDKWKQALPRLCTDDFLDSTEADG